MRFFFDLLYPSRCPLCDELHPERKLCKNCSASLHFLKGDFTAPHLDRVWFNRARSCVAYEGNMVEAVHALKYYLRFDLVAFFASLLADEIKQMGSYDVIIPVPLNWKRLWRRGYNQSAMLSRSVAKKMNMKVDCSSLRKNKKTIPQVGLDRETRLKNVKGAFDVNPRRILQLKGASVLLIDDVLTTGATVNECAKVLIKKAAVELVDVITIARTI